MSKNSLFAILMRSPWWVSLLVAVAVIVAAHFALPQKIENYAWVMGLPFVFVGAMAAWKQLRVPSPERVAATLQAAGALSWRDFADAMEEALKRDGYTVTRLNGPAADFALDKQGRSALLSCKRWKAARHGLEPLRELEAARQAQQSDEAIYVSIVELTENAQRFATEKGMRLLQGATLAQLLRDAVTPVKAAA